MDIPAVSVVLNQNKVQQQASLAVMKMAMDVTSNQSADFLESLQGVNTKAMETFIQPFLGANLDIQA